ncbi:MAG: hypothetical protein AB1631_32675 [Acidobacteriota bacterium]
MMRRDRQQNNELHLKVFADRSELVRPDGATEIFNEGPMSEQAKERYRRITDALANGFLESQIARCRDNPESLTFDSMREEHKALIDRLTGSMTGEVGRALIGLTVLQLCIKSIEPDQNIRLHKGGSVRTAFSWNDGISMRSLDNQYITPTLRNYDLLKLNKDGFMMTRTLAENYPYSKVYKANIRGARDEWATIVEGIEAREIEPDSSLHYLLSKLLNSANDFKILADETLKLMDVALNENKICSPTDALGLLERHINESNHAARIMEIAMHSLMQAEQEAGALGAASLIPLSQMRSANKKHGNIGDIELMEDGSIIEAWDAKFGKTYLRDELEEINDKIESHTDVRLVGFVTSERPERLEELEARRADIEQTHDVSLKILTLREWVDEQISRTAETGVEESDLARMWMTAYVESLAQRRPEIAPIDEPCYQWLQTLNAILKNV